MKLSRGEFVDLSAGSAAILATRASASAATLGQTEASKGKRPVAESRPTFGSEGRTLDAFAARPQTGTARGGVVVVQAIWGVDSQLQSVVRRLAAEGYVAIAPDLYTGIGPASPTGQSDIATYKTFAAKLVDATVDADVAAAAAHLRTSGNASDLKVGVIGFCMGGAITLRQTVDTPTFAAASVFYGKVRYGTNGNEGPITPIALAYADEMRVPTAGSWGGKDTSILAADVNALDERLTSLSKPHDFRVYPEAGHAFFDDTRSSYVASAAEDAWKRTLGWFATHLS